MSVCLSPPQAAGLGSLAGGQSDLDLLGRAQLARVAGVDDALAGGRRAHVGQLGPAGGQVGAELLAGGLLAVGQGLLVVAGDQGLVDGRKVLGLLADELGAGVYSLRMTSGQFSDSRTIVIRK